MRVRVRARFGLITNDGGWAHLFSFRSPQTMQFFLPTSHYRIPARRGLSLVELLTVIAIIGILIAMLLPAVQAIRESVRQLQCRNRLRQIGCACHNFNLAHQRLPAGWSSETGWGWMTAILPQIEQQNLHNTLELGRPLSGTQSAALATPITLARCPSAEHDDTVDHATCDFVGNAGSITFGVIQSIFR